MLVDGAGVIYRQDYESYEGSANFKGITERNRLGRQSRAAELIQAPCQQPEHHYY
ncbi:MAG: hypothetical protein ACI9HA_002781, partial [Dinoroseobacter sp.]